MSKLDSKELEQNNQQSRDKLRKICDIIRTETLDPVKEEAELILKNAREEASRLVEEGKKEADDFKARARQEMVKERKLFENSLAAAGAQAVTYLQQEIEKRLFDEGLASWLATATEDPKLAAKLIEALVEAVKKEGSSTNFSAAVGSKVDVESVNKALAAHVLSALAEKQVVIGQFQGGGVRLRLHDHHLTLDLSSEAVQELLAKYVRKDFQRHLFALNQQKNG